MSNEKINEALEKYNLDLNDEQILAEVKTLLEKHLEENMTFAEN